MTIHTLKKQQAAYEDKLKGWMKNKWLYLLIYPLFIIAYYKLRLAWVNWRLSKLVKNAPLIDRIELSVEISTNNLSNPSANQNKSLLESIDNNIRLMALSYLNKKDLHSVAQCSRTLFISANSAQVKRDRAHRFKCVLVKRKFDEVRQLLEKDRSLATIPFFLKANPYYNSCPEMRMTADMFACWLGDEPMMAVLMESAKLDPVDREKTINLLKDRSSIGGPNSLDGGSRFNFSELLRVTDQYDKDRSEENKKALKSAIYKCPKYVIDVAAWMYCKEMTVNEIVVIDVWRLALRGMWRAPGGWTVSVVHYVLAKPHMLSELIKSHFIHEQPELKVRYTG